MLLGVLETMLNGSKVYCRMNRYGSQHPLSDRDRFLLSTSKPRAAVKDCWEWAGYTNSQTGYGQMTCDLDGGRTMTAPRVAAWLFHGAPPFEKAIVLHSCDNRTCVSPFHIRWGTYGENNQDANKRSPRRHGEDHPQARYSDAIVEQARSLKTQGVSMVKIAVMLGVPYDTVTRWCSGKSRAYKSQCVRDHADRALA